MTRFSVRKFIERILCVGVPLILVEAYIVFQCRADSMLLSSYYILATSWADAPAAESQHLWKQFTQQEDTRPVIHKTGIGTKSKDNRIRSSEKPDGYFSGFPVYFRDEDVGHPTESMVHCTGETYREPWKSGKEWIHDSSWLYRSCEFHFFCFDLEDREFVLFSNASYEARFQKMVDDDPYKDISPSHILNYTRVHDQPSEYPFGVAVGAINTKWGWKSSGIPRIKWFPKVLSSEESPNRYYELDSHVVMVPYHSLSAFNPGHLVWDDFLPIYTLLNIFNFEDEPWEPLLVRYRLMPLSERALWATCDFTGERREICKRMLRKFGPLMIRRGRIHTQDIVNLTADPDDDAHPISKPKSRYVCARRGAAGIGALTDHGINKGHGWEPQDTLTSYNTGRGGVFWRFRNYMMHSLAEYHRDLKGLQIAEKKLSQESFHRRHRIIFSTGSSRRNLDFSQHINFLKRILDPNYATVETHTFSEYSMPEQVEIASQTSVYVTICGGGAVTGMFLPKGAVVILFFIEDGGIRSNRNTGLPARLDWDLFNHMSHLRVHWLPKRTMASDIDLNAFLEIIQHDLSLLDHDHEAAWPQQEAN